MIIHPVQQHGAYTLGAAFLGCLRLDFTFGRLEGWLGKRWHMVTQMPPNSVGLGGLPNGKTYLFWLYQNISVSLCIWYNIWDFLDFCISIFWNFWWFFGGLEHQVYKLFELKLKRWVSGSTTAYQSQWPNLVFPGTHPINIVEIKPHWSVLTVDLSVFMSSMIITWRN